MPSIDPRRLRVSFTGQPLLAGTSFSIRAKRMVRTLSVRPTTVSHDDKIDTHCAHDAPPALAAGVVVHNRLGTESLADDTVATQTASVATAEPAAPPPVSLPPASPPVPASQEASRVEDAAPAQTASIGTAGPAGPTTVRVQPFSAAPAGTPGIEPPPGAAPRCERGLGRGRASVAQRSSEALETFNGVETPSRPPMKPMRRCQDAADIR
jgi:hypothetical protein